MFPRISAALSEFVTPIISRGTQPVKPGESTQFKRFDPETTQPEEQAHKEASSEQDPDRDDQPPLAPVIPLRAEAQQEKAGDNSLSSTLLHILSLFKEQHAALIRTIGARTYSSIDRKQKRTLSSRKGAILDQKAE